jgi:hypothetical protein
MIQLTELGGIAGDLLIRKKGLTKKESLKV